MKKLAGLLLFSQAATADVMRIDRTNYVEHLCDSTLFKVEGKYPRIGPYASGFEVDSQRTILSNYREYCAADESYEKAKDKTVPYFGCASVVAKNQEECIEKTGVALAKSCEKLRRNKFAMGESWKKTVSNMQTCAVMRAGR